MNGYTLVITGDGYQHQEKNQTDILGNNNNNNND
jgi:hypothetical protein